MRCETSIRHYVFLTFVVCEQKGMKIPEFILFVVGDVKVNIAVVERKGMEIPKFMILVVGDKKEKEIPCGVLLSMNGTEICIS